MGRRQLQAIGLASRATWLTKTAYPGSRGRVRLDTPREFDDRTGDRARRENEEALTDLRKRFASLSSREREIVIQVARGRLSKQIAHDIGIAEATVKVHRSRAMHKMKAGSLPELGRMADRLKLVTEGPRRS